MSMLPSTIVLFTESALLTETSVNSSPPPNSIPAHEWKWVRQGPLLTDGDYVIMSFIANKFKLVIFQGAWWDRF